MSPDRRTARVVGAVSFGLAATLPWVLFWRVIAGIAHEFRMDLHYFVSEWTPWALIVAGLLFLVPVALSAGRDPDSRWYPHARNAYAGWGISLYLLGVLLGSQVSQLYSLSAP